MVEEEIQDLTLWQRLAGIVTQPKVTLAAVVEKPTILGPALIISLVSLVLFLITSSKLKQYTLMTLEKMPQQLSPDQLAQTKSFMSVGLIVGGGFSALAVPLLGCLIFTLLFKFFNLFIGNEAPFKKLYAVSVITYVPSVLGNTLRSIMVAFSPAENLSSISTSAALVLPKSNMGPLFAFLSYIDPFFIWSMALLAIGGAMVLKTSVKKTGIFVFIICLLWAVIATSLVALNPQQFPKV